MATLLAPYLADAKGVGRESGELLDPSGELIRQLSLYLDLLLRWNERMNLTAIRGPEQMVTRHFGESLLLARLVPPETQTLLDLGSGAGFPGIPIQLLWPELRVTLAESQGKKASFLREVARTLELPTVVHAGRAEELMSEAAYDVVALRAVDEMEAAVQLAGRLGRRVVLLTSADSPVYKGLMVTDQLAVPGTRDGLAVLCLEDADVPRGTVG